jgi:gamma-glutamyltranspeptidase/glutathione hydrolase
MAAAKPAHRSLALVVATTLLALGALAGAQEAKTSNKPALHGQHWVAITGKPLGATAGALMFARGGNAVDAACAMLGAVATMWDTLSWGGETQALIHDPRTGQVKAINALGVAPTGATPEFFRSQGMAELPAFGPLAAITPGTPGGLMVMLAEFGTMSLEEVLGPAMEMAAGYPIERNLTDTIEARKNLLRQWEASRRILLPHDDETAPGAHAAPYPGEVFRQPELLTTLSKLVAAERTALAAGRTREQAILAAYDRFYRGDIAEDLVAATRAAGGLFTLDDLDQWQVYVEEPVSTRYKDIDVYKLSSWVQGPVMLQTLNILEEIDLTSMGYNSTQYMHALYQSMNLSFADRDFYYGDPYLPPTEPIAGLLSKDYARDRRAQIDWRRNDPLVRPGDPYPYQGDVNPFKDLLDAWQPRIQAQRQAGLGSDTGIAGEDDAFLAGTTSIQAADADGWVVSITPSGGWVPAFIAGDTGIGLSQRMQSFDLDAGVNPFNVLEPGKRPRATLSPGFAMRNGRPYLSFAAQGGDTQDQNLLQLFLNVAEFGMDVQQAVEAANINSYQMHGSFGGRKAAMPGRLVVRSDTPARVVEELRGMGYNVEGRQKTSGPINAIFFDQEHGTLWGGSSDFDDDYGIAW